MIEVFVIRLDREQQIYQQITNLRARMVEEGMANGLDHPLTIQLSQELDLLLEQYRNLKENQGK
ncbi:Spo0E family sporulation regulatory protein-aspartic acid phosphatase [Piscibacillus salipiscarius]|uniref:Spo0E family sporulation regulatory protein-aspartic acid phosphatase n=2 Tax=Piscibacillus salipiscarius TaxID=299480 RepID=A0ABW5Q6M4_9BACI